MLLSSGFQMMRFSNHLIDFIWGHSSFSSSPSMRGATPAGDLMQATEFHPAGRIYRCPASSGGNGRVDYSLPVSYRHRGAAVRQSPRPDRYLALHGSDDSSAFNGVDLTMEAALPCHDRQVQSSRPMGVLHSTVACCAMVARRRRTITLCMVKCPSRHGQGRFCRRPRRARGAYVRVTGEVEYVMGFGANYSPAPA